jgi:hypothetical protein
MNIMQIQQSVCRYENEPLISPFCFKGNALTRLWQTVVYIKGSSHSAIGLGVQSVLWSDAKVFSTYGEEQGNTLMFRITQYALSQAEKIEFNTPLELMNKLFPIALDYGKNITASPDLRATFVLNALVPIDFAVWSLYAKENHISNFDQLISSSSAVSYHHAALANIPLVTYNCPIEDVVQLAKDGACVFKIKVGSDPEKDNNPDKMLAWDKARIFELHNVLKEYSTPYTKSGNLLYYLDANGRYDSKEHLMCLLDYLKKINAIDRVILFEEPFSEDNKIDVHDIPVCITADESAHCLKDVEERIALGYRAITLKPIAKTLSFTLEMLDYATARGIDCFCADLTVNPVMVEWNKNVAASIKPLPDMKIGMVESNGPQNYANWDKMLGYHPLFGKDFISSSNGVFHLDDSFYDTNGGIFLPLPHYQDLIDKN